MVRISKIWNWFQQITPSDNGKSGVRNYFSKPCISVGESFISIKNSISNLVEKFFQYNSFAVCEIISTVYTLCVCHVIFIFLCFVSQNSFSRLHTTRKKSAKCVRNTKTCEKWNVCRGLFMLMWLLHETNFSCLAPRTVLY